MLGKRKRSLSTESQQRDSLIRVLTEQLDLEIALKARLLEAARARIEWANLLKSKLEENSQEEALTDESSPTLFRDVALAAFEEIEASCLIITSPQSRLLAPLTNGRPPPPAPPPPIEAPRTRKRVTLGLAQPPIPFHGPLLFEDQSTATTVKLICTDCSRGDFPTIQGFLNHCRLAHSRIYDTHDECIQATGVKIDKAERDALVANGVEISTVHLPSLRGMFQRAVGIGVGDGTTGTDEGSSTVLSQTLGLHKDSPILAPFLGKEVRKKVIHVYDDEDVDILDVEEEIRRPLYGTQIIQRLNKKNSDDASFLAEAIRDAEKKNNISVALTPSSLVSDAQFSRFHVTRRVAIMDRSLYLAENKRPTFLTAHTHRWQLSVSSPSYSQHISTFLSHFTVTCLTQPPIFSKEITVFGPPFVACSTTDRPFLARLTLHWVDDRNHPFEIDHWVELDTSRTSRIISGEEQMFDVELDRNTGFKPKNTSDNTLPWDGESDYQETENASQHVFQLDMTEAKLEDYASFTSVLKKIVPQFPIISQDMPSGKLPYLVSPTRAKYFHLVTGRRKAIEWARALAIQQEYNGQAASSGLRQLTTAEVFRWLDANGFYPRPPLPVAPPKEQSLPAGYSGTSSIVALRYCSVCGVDLSHHNPAPRCGNYYRIPGEDASFACQCSSDLQRRRAPIIHIYSLLSGNPYVPHPIAFSSSDARHLVRLAHPKLIRFVRDQALRLRLDWVPQMPDIKELHRVMHHNELSLGSSPREIDDVLAPHAYLAMAVEKLIKELVARGLDVAREMQSRTKAAIIDSATKGSLLTPTHVLQSLTPTPGGGRRELLAKFFSRIGTVLQAEGATSDTKVAGTSREA